MGSATTNYVYGIGGEVLAEYSSSGGSLLNYYIYFGGQRIARRDGSGNVYFYYADALGSSRIITNTNASGTVTVCYDSDFYPFGIENNVTNTCPQNYKSTGQERDSESSNDSYWARYFGVLTSRWMSPDPLGGDITNPQSLNRYAYVLNNPTTLVDPLGLEAADCNDPDDAVGNAECDTPPWLPGIGDTGGGGGGGGTSRGGRGGSTGATGGGSVYAGNAAWSEGYQPPIYPMNLWQIFGPPGSLYMYPCDFGTCTAVPESGFLSGAGGAPTFTIYDWEFLSYSFALGYQRPPQQSVTAPPRTGKWWPSTDPSSCSLYAPGSLPASVCRQFPSGPRANSVRGCLQQYYFPDYGYLPLLSWGSGASWLEGLDQRLGFAEHAYCIPEGALNP